MQDVAATKGAKSAISMSRIISKKAIMLTQDRSKRVGRSAHEPTVAKGDKLVPLRRVLKEVLYRDGLRSFVLYSLFFAFYFALASYRFDTALGNEMRTWLTDAIQGEYDLIADETNGWCAELDCYKPFNTRGNVDELVDFVSHDLTTIADAVNGACPKCGMAMSELSKDVRELSLTEYICTDFVPWTPSEADQASLSHRDCDAVDADFRSEPDANKAPCCIDADLRAQSVSIMAAQAAGVDVGSDTDLLRLYIDQTLNTNTPVVQLIVKRDRHFVGIVYSSRWQDREWLPERVRSSTQYWSYYFDEEGGSSSLLVLAAIFAALSLMHEGVELYSRMEETADIWEEAFSPFMILIEWPSIIVPWVIELSRSSLTLYEYSLIVSIIELVMFARLFAEGQVLPPFALIVKTLITSTQQLIIFTFAIVVAIMIFAGINAQLFGTFEDDFGNYGTSVTSIFTVLINGNGLRDSQLEFSPAPALLMHYVMNLFIYLILAQFFIAILVSALDVTREAQLEHKADTSVPVGFKALPKRRIYGLSSVQDTVVYLFTYKVHGTFSYELIKRVRKLIRVADERRAQELHERDELFETQPLMLTRAQLDEHLGQDLADKLMEAYGAVLDKDPALVGSLLMLEDALAAGDAGDSGDGRTKALGESADVANGAGAVGRSQSAMAPHVAIAGRSGAAASSAAGASGDGSGPATAVSWFSSLRR